MRSRLIPLLIALPLLAAGSAPVQSSRSLEDVTLHQARAEAARAEQRVADLERRADQAGDEAARLKAGQIAAAASIEAAEARISASNAELRLARTRQLAQERKLALGRAPIAALLAGLATMSRQPPLLTIADDGSIEEMVRVRALLDATIPEIERRNSELKAQLLQSRRLAQSVEAARAALHRDSRRLREQQQRFAKLEMDASARAASLSGAAIGAGDRFLATDESAAAAEKEASAARSGRVVARELARLALAPRRPVPDDDGHRPAGLPYSLPSDAPLLDGLGSVDGAGIVSRGIRLATHNGSELKVPASGTIAFSGPFRGQDGVIIIDHGKGWTTLVLGAAGATRRGGRVERGQLLGRALGPVTVELRHDGRPISPAFIAASSIAVQ